MKDTRKTTKTAAKTASGTFSADERAAMKERAAEMKAAQSKEDGEKDLLAKIAELPEPDRALAKRVHAIVMQSGPGLSPKTWYGMPAYAINDKIICFFQPASKFKYRYATLGFNEAAKLDDGNMWPTAYALTRLTAADEKAIAALVKQAVG